MSLIVMERLRALAIRAQDEAPERLEPDVRRRLERAAEDRVPGTRYERIDLARCSDSELAALDRMLGSGGDFWDWAVVEGALERLSA